MPLVFAMMAVTLMTGLATTVVVGTMTETAIAGSYGEAAAVFYAAEAAVEFAVSDLTTVAWDEAVAGDVRSAFADGPPGGERHVGAATIDLTQATSDIDTLTAAGRAGSPSRLYAYGSFANLVAAEAGRSPLYVAVWIADLTADGGDTVLGVIGRAYGPTGSRRTIAVSVARGDTMEAPLRVLSWAELR